MMKVRIYDVWLCAAGFVAYDLALILFGYDHSANRGEIILVEVAFPAALTLITWVKHRVERFCGAAMSNCGNEAV